MNSLTFRDALVATLQDWSKQHPDVRMQYENGTLVDLDNDTRPMVFVDLRYTDTQQADLNEQPLIVDSGSILLTVYVREHTGTRLAYQLREDLAVHLQRRELGGAKILVGRKVANVTQIKGWLGYRLALPFTHYYLS